MTNDNIFLKTTHLESFIIIVTVMTFEVASRRDREREIGGVTEWYQSHGYSEPGCISGVG